MTSLCEYPKLAIEAVVPAPTPEDYDEIAAVTGRVFVAQTPEQFTYDADGNMTCDGRFRYTWNAKNRLVRAQELVAPTNRNPYTVAYAYDHKGRMVSKRITENDGSDTLVKSITYIWDGWNIIREIQWPVTSGQWPVVTDNVWGLDLNGTLQGAGGVGGLLAVIRSNSNSNSNSNSSLYFPTYDANGNISEYVSEGGEVVAHYDYSPFGETLIESGDLASTFTHRFSTKPWCPVTGLYEYQMRKYRPGIGRWLSRDPIGEETGANIALMCKNNLLCIFDELGLLDGSQYMRVVIGDMFGIYPPYTPPPPPPPPGPGAGDQLNPFGFRGQTGEVDYRDWFEFRFPKAIEGAKDLFMKRIAEQACSQVSSHPESLPDFIDRKLDVDMEKPGTRFGDVPEGFYEKHFSLGDFEFKCENISLSWESECCGKFQGTMYVLEQTGADSPFSSGFSYMPDILYFTGLFVKRNVRMAEWTITGGFCCE